MKVFFSVPTSAVDDVYECGLKVSEYKNRTVSVGDAVTNFIAAKLNPGDIEKTDDKTVIRLVPDEAHCYVAEGAFYEEHILCMQSGGDDFWLRKYEATVIPVSEYKFGMYRNPDYLIGRTLFPGQIERFDRRKGEPILYNDSDELYVGRMVRTAEDMCENFYEVAVRAVFEKCDFEVIEGQKYRIFKNESNSTFIVKK